MGFYEKMTDAELVRLLNKGDRKAFEEIYSRYWDKLFYAGAKKLQDLAIAENLVQDIFVDIWQRKDSIRIDESLNNYLAVALKYKVINFQARKFREERFRQYAGAQLQSSNLSTEEHLNFEQLKSRLALLVNQLPAQCKIAYQLREEGLSQKEIARTMQLSEHTVERHVSRALQLLRRRIAQFLAVWFILFF